MNPVAAETRECDPVPLRGWGSRGCRWGGEREPRLASAVSPFHRHGCQETARRPTGVAGQPSLCGAPKAALRIVRPPAPGRARAASAASEMGSTPAALRFISAATPDGAAGPDGDPVPVSRSSLEAGRKNDCASPGSDDASPIWVIAAKMDAATPPSGATPVAMSATGIPANARSRGNSDATHACTDADSAALSIRPPLRPLPAHPGDAE